MPTWLILILWIFCSVLFIILIQITMIIFHRASINVPGKLIERTFSQQSECKLDLCEGVGTRQEIPLSVVTNGAYSEAIGLNHWRLVIKLSVSNHRCNQASNIVDLHAHVYCLEGLIVPPASITYMERLNIYHTNSIIPGGLEYQLTPNERCPLEVCLEISRNDSGRLFCVFGLFLDCNFRNNGQEKYFRIPSDSIYAFQNDTDEGVLIFINEDNLPQYQKRMSQYPNRKLMKQFEIALGQHLREIHELTTGSRHQNDK